MPARLPDAWRGFLARFPGAATIITALANPVSSLRQTPGNWTGGKGYAGNNITNFKTWRIMHTDCRRPVATFPETISSVVALHFYATA